MWTSWPDSKAWISPGVLGQVGDAAQFDLVVVGHQQLAALGGHEHLPEHPTGLGADRDVVQVGGVGAEAPGAGHRLVERGPDAVVGLELYGGHQALSVGGAQLLHLPVVQQRVHHRVLAPQLLQGASIGGVGPGAGLLLRGKAQLVEQQLAHLLGGVHVEAPLPRGLEHQRPKPLGVGHQLVAQGSQSRHVHPDAHVLHTGQHPDQGNFHVVVEISQALGIQGLQQGRGQMGHGQGVEASLHRRLCLVAGIVVEQPALIGLDSPRQLHRRVGPHEIVELVAPAGRIEQIGGNLSVQGQPRGVDPPRQQPQDQRLHVMGQERGARAEECGQGVVAC